MTIPKRVEQRLLKIVRSGDRALVSGPPRSRWQVTADATRRKLAAQSRRVKPWLRRKRGAKRVRLAFEPFDLGGAPPVNRGDLYGSI